MHACRLDKLISNFLNKESTCDKCLNSNKAGADELFAKDCPSGNRNRRFQRQPLKRVPELDVGDDHNISQSPPHVLDNSVVRVEADPEVLFTSASFNQVLLPEICPFLPIPGPVSNTEGMVDGSLSNNPATTRGIESSSNSALFAVSSSTNGFSSLTVTPSAVAGLSDSCMSANGYHVDCSANALQNNHHLSHSGASLVTAKTANYNNYRLGNNPHHALGPTNLSIKLELNPQESSGNNSMSATTTHNTPNSRACISSAYAYAAAANFAEFLSGNAGLCGNSLSAAAAAAAVASRMEHHSHATYPPVPHSLPSATATAANYASYDGATNGASTYATSAYYQHYQPIQSPTSLQQQNSGNGSYVLQSGQSNSPPGSGDEDNSGSGGMGHTARTPPETLEWLQNNYEPAEGASLPRCTLYDHYLSHCAEAQLEPVNAASFGKLIRSVFKGLRTRRLGTRGNSKYHYNGIRIKPSSSLLTIVSPEEYNRMNTSTHQTTRNPRRISGVFQQLNGTPSNHSNGMQQQQNRSNNSTPGAPVSSYQLRSRTLQPDSPNSISSNHPTNDYKEQGVDGVKKDDYLNENELIAHYENPIMGQPGFGNNSDIPEQTRGAFNNNRSRMNSSNPASLTKINGIRASRASMASQSNGTSSESEAQSIAMGAGQVPRVPMPNLDELEEYLLPLGYTVAHVLKFTDAYASNCAEILESTKRLNFDGMEHAWTKFWQCSDADKQSLNMSLLENGGSNHVICLEQLHVFRLCTLPQIQKYVETMDMAFYQVILEVLIPHVLRPALTPRLSCQIRNFAKNVDSWTLRVLENAPSNIKQSKLASVRLLANALTRYTSFNHLADAVRAVLKNKEQINQMYTDFCKVDFGIVHSQSDWICGCDHTLVSSIEREFKENLRQQKNLDEWTEWMEAVVDQVLAKYHDKPIHVQLEVSKQFLLKWSFYSSMILRDFTCRSAKSFGSFHLIRLFYDEYLFLLVEMRLAKATNQPIICVMSQSWLQTYQSPRSNHAMLQSLPTTSAVQQQPSSYANNHMLALNSGVGAIPTTAYVSPSLIEPTYSQINSVSCSAASAHPHIVIPSHNTSTGIHYVLDNNQSPKYPTMPALISPVDPHSHDLGDILVRDDPSMASVNHHQPNNGRRSSFGMETTNNSNGNGNRYMMLNSQQQEPQEQQDYPSTPAAIGTIVYMEEDDGLRNDTLHRTEEEEDEDLEHSALQEEEEEDQNFMGDADAMMLEGLKSEEDNGNKTSSSPFDRHIGMRVKKEMEAMTNK